MTWCVLQTPNFLRHLDNQPELGSLVLHRQLIAEHGAGKAALWTDTELVERNVLACLVDAALQINAPDLVENAAKIKCPVLFIRGDQEPTDNYHAERFKENCAGPYEVVIVPNCDHFYVGAEERLAKTVTEWLSRTLSD